MANLDLTPEALSERNTLTQRIQDQVVRSIRCGEIAPGQRLASERQLAKRFGVGLHTVNRAMAGLAAQGLVERTRGRGTYVRQDVARGVVPVVFSSRLMTLSDSSPFYAELVDRFRQELTGAGFRHQFLLASGGSPREYVESLHPDSGYWHTVAGVLTGVPLHTFEDELAQRGIPVVTVGSSNHGKHRVWPDYPELGRRAAEHLVRRGYRRIGLITPCPWEDQEHHTVGDFRQALREAGLGLDRRHCVCGADFSRGREAMQELWARVGPEDTGGDRPEAIFVSDDMLGVGVAEAICELGIACPQELAVICQATDGVPIRFALPFSTCRFNVARWSRAATGLLDRLIRTGGEEPARIALKPRIVQGETT